MTEKPKCMLPEDEHCDFRNENGRCDWYLDSKDGHNLCNQQAQPRLVLVDGKMTLEWRRQMDIWVGKRLDQ